MRVPGHCGIPDNEKADKLATQGLATPLLGPEPALGIPRCSAREAIKNWLENQHRNT
jgi:ribonuclease HI